MKNELALNGEKIYGKIAEDNLSGVGMIRGEYLLRDINKSILTLEGRKRIYEYLKDICNIYHDDEVWYRFSELTSAEINILDGTNILYEEEHHLLGTRGLRRSEQVLDEFEQEIETIIKVHKECPNLSVFLPFVNDAQQLQRAISYLRERGYQGQIGTMIEIPSAYFEIKKIAETEITRVVVGLNDFTSFIFAAPRESTYHQMDSALIEQLIVEMHGIVTATGKELLLAGYLDKNIIQKFNRLEIPCIVHYHFLPQIYGIDVEYPNHVSEVKKKTKKSLIAH